MIVVDATPRHVVLDSSQLRIVLSTGDVSAAQITAHNADEDSHPHLLDLIDNVSTGGNVDGGTFI